MNSSSPQEQDVPSKSAKLVQIIDDTVQILIDDNELMRDDDELNDGMNEINAEEIIYDVLKVLEECSDPELSLEMIVPIIGALQKYIINLGDSPNLFLVQLFLHLLQTCLSGIKGEYVLPKSIIQHILEVVIDKVPQDNSILVEKLFLLGAVISNCTTKEIAQMNYLCKQFLVPLLKQDISTEVLEAATGCITDCSNSFKSEFQSERELIQLLIQRLQRSLSNSKETEALLNAFGDAALAGGLCQNDILDVFKIVDQLVKSPKKVNSLMKFIFSKVELNVRMSLIQMHTCIFNSFSDDQGEFLNSIITYVKLIIQFVISSLSDFQEQISKQQSKESLSLLLDIGVLYGKSSYFEELKYQIWSSESKEHFRNLKKLLLENEDNKTLLYFENVLLKIFEVDYGAI